MKKILALLLTVVMLLSLAACGGGEPDPNAGVYQGVRGEMDGIVLTMEELYPGESYLELKDGGKADLVLEGDKITGKWTLEGDKFNLVVEGEDCPGTLKDGIVTFDFTGIGLYLTFAKDGVKVPPSEFSEVGSYHFYGIDEAGEYIDYDTLVEVGMENISYAIFNEDGTGILALEGEELPFTYEDGMIMDEDGGEYPYLLTDGTIMEVYLGDGMTFYYEKGDIVRYSESGIYEEESSEDEYYEEAVSDGPCGVYRGTTYEAAGQTFEMTDIYSSVCYLELLEDGSGTLTLGEEAVDITWSLDGENFILNNQMVESEGTLKNGEIVFDFMGLDMIMTFVKDDGGEAGAPQEENDGIVMSYQLYAVDQDGEYTDNETVQMIGLQDTNYMVFFDDGTVFVCMEEEELLCTYDETYIYDDEGYSIEYAIVDGLLELYMEDNMTFYYEEF